MEGFDTFTFPSAESREAFKSAHTPELCGVEFEYLETEEIKGDTVHAFFLHSKRLSPTLKSLLSEVKQCQ